jgi:glycosyltransferase involved in cell wall biosynthesis
MRATDVCLVIPTFNERENIRPLLRELETALAGQSWTVLFVDDSDDETDRLIDELARSDARIALLHRVENRGGLAGAVVEGLAHASGTYVCVLDADLQHPPSTIPALLAEAQKGSADLVIASRYIQGGRADGLDGFARQLISRLLRSLSKLMFPQRLGKISDPLGGFFLVRRSILEGATLRPVGYKILLEILIRCQWRNVTEIPYTFEPRLHCESKAGIRQGMQFIQHLCILAWSCSPMFAGVRRHQRDVSVKDMAPSGLRLP